MSSFSISSPHHPSLATGGSRDRHSTPYGPVSTVQKQFSNAPKIIVRCPRPSKFRPASRLVTTEISTGEAIGNKRHPFLEQKCLLGVPLAGWKQSPPPCRRCRGILNPMSPTTGVPPYSTTHFMLWCCSCVKRPSPCTEMTSYLAPALLSHTIARS